MKAKHGLPSDYALAQKLDLTRSSISKFRVGKDCLGEETACKVAELLNLEPGYVMACIASERAKKPEVKAAWKHTAEVLYGLAAVFTMVAILPTATLPAWNGFNAALRGLDGDNTVYYVKSILQYWPVLLPLAILVTADTWFERFSPSQFHHVKTFCRCKN